MDDRIKKVMALIFRIPENTITEQTTLKTCKQWTSKKHIMLTVALEQEFKIEGQLSVDEIIQMVNLTKIKEILSKHL